MAENLQEIRLNKFLSEMGICSRREADRLVEAGRITVDGKTARMGQKVTKEQEIICDGTVICGKKDPEHPERGNRPKPVWLVVNKPRGIVCTTSDKDRATNIVELIHYPVRVYPVGRLDKDSEGLILMTNQGSLVNPIMRSGNAHEKEYEVRINRPVTKEFLEAMAAGVALPELNQTTRPCEIEAIGKDSFRIILTQGLNRQIRRMCEALGCRVLELKRTRIMNIRLGNLKSGSFRRMTREEYEELLWILEESGSSSLPYAERQQELSGTGQPDCEMKE